MIKPQILPLSEDFKKLVGMNEEVDYFVTNNVEFESDKNPPFGKISSLKWTYKVIESKSYVEFSLIVPDQKVTVISSSADSEDEEFQIQLSHVQVEIKKTKSLQFSPELVEVWAGKVKVEF